MEVTVKLYDTLRRLSVTEDKGIWKGEIPEGTTIDELIVLIGSRSGEISCAAVNGKIVPRDTLIKDLDVIALATNVNGG